MASIKVYNPRTSAFELLPFPSDTQVPRSELLLLNILVELQVLTMILSETNKQPMADRPEILRASVVSELQ